MYTIKRLGIESLDSILSLEESCFPAPDRWKLADWKELLEDERAVFMNVSVHPDYRNQGVASRLLNRVTEDMKNDGMYLFRGETRSTNTAMQKAFESCGYELNRVEEGYFHDPEEPGWKYLLSL